MYCLWEQFGLIDTKGELSLNGMLTFFQRIPAYRAEVQKAIRECKGVGKYLGKFKLHFLYIKNYNYNFLQKKFLHRENFKED